MYPFNRNAISCPEDEVPTTEGKNTVVFTPLPVVTILISKVAMKKREKVAKQCERKLSNVKKKQLSKKNLKKQENLTIFYHQDKSEVDLQKT